MPLDGKLPSMSKQQRIEAGRSIEAEKAGDGGVRAVERALDILLAFKGVDSGLTVGELIKRVDLSRPTLYRLLHTLERFWRERGH